MDHDQQEHLLREAENTQVTVAHRELMRHNLRTDGMALAQLGRLVQARTIAREKIAKVPLEDGEKAVLQALKLQGQIAGIDLAIDIIFDIANFEEEVKQDG